MGHCELIPTKKKPSLRTYTTKNFIANLCQKKKTSLRTYTTKNHCENFIANLYNKKPSLRTKKLHCELKKQKKQKKTKKKPKQTNFIANLYKKTKTTLRTYTKKNFIAKENFIANFLRKK